MSIRGKITALTLVLVAAVVCGVAAAVLLLERSQVRAQYLARADALADGLRRIAVEAAAAEDELLLLGTLQLAMKEDPTFVWAEVRREDHVSRLGAAQEDTLLKGFSAAGGTFVFEVTLGFSPRVLDEQTAAAQRSLAARIGAVAFAGLLLGALGSWALGRVLSAPLAELSAAAHRLGSGDLGAEVAAGGRDEIGRLGSDFNAMAGRLRALMQSKEDLFGALTHELSAPLTGLKGFLETLLERPDRGAEEREALETMAAAAGQMEVSLSNALGLMRREDGVPPPPELMSVRDLVAQTLQLFAPMARIGGVTLVGPDGTAEGRMAGDREGVRKVLVNLLLNAVKFSPPGGTVRVGLTEDAGSLTVAVADEGPGVAEADREKIFTKFYRAPGADGKPQRVPGSGLGLAIAKKAVENHGGRLWVESELGKGSVFRARLPKSGGRL